MLGGRPQHPTLAERLWHCGCASKYFRSGSDKRLITSESQPENSIESQAASVLRATMYGTRDPLDYPTFPKEVSDGVSGLERVLLGSVTERLLATPGASVFIGR